MFDIYILLIYNGHLTSANNWKKLLYPTKEYDQMMIIFMKKNNLNSKRYKYIKPIKLHKIINKISDLII